MTFAQAFWTGAGGGLPAEATRCHFRADDAGGHGDDAPAEQHHHRGNKTAEVGMRGDVAITDRGHGHHGPVHGRRDAGIAILRAFDHIFCDSIMQNIA